jgi:hypothetical protein
MSVIGVQSGVLVELVLVVFAEIFVIFVLIHVVEIILVAGTVGFATRVAALLPALFAENAVDGLAVTECKLIEVVK